MALVVGVCAACAGKVADQGPHETKVTGAGGKARNGTGGEAGSDGGPSAEGGRATASGGSGGAPPQMCPPVPFHYDGRQETKTVDGCDRVVLSLHPQVIDGRCYLPFPPGADDTVEYGSLWELGMQPMDITFSRLAYDGPCKNTWGSDYGWIPHDCESVELCAYNFCPMFLASYSPVDVVMPCGWSLPP